MYVVSYTPLLSTSLGGDACAEDNDEKAVPIGVEYYNTPERVAMVSVLCVVSPVALQSHHCYRTSAVLQNQWAISIHSVTTYEP